MKISVSAFVCVAALALGACGSTEEDLCDAKCECEGCSDAQFDDCVYHYDSDLREAERFDCVDYYDELLDCRDQTGVCHGADWDDSCGPEKDRLKNCTGYDSGRGK